MDTCLLVPQLPVQSGLTVSPYQVEGVGTPVFVHKRDGNCSLWHWICVVFPPPKPKGTLQVARANLNPVLLFLGFLYSETRQEVWVMAQLFQICIPL